MFMAFSIFSRCNSQGLFGLVNKLYLDAICCIYITSAIHQPEWHDLRLGDMVIARKTSFQPVKQLLNTDQDLSRP